MRWRPAIGASVRDCAACRRAPKVTLGTTRGRQASRERMAPRVGGLATTPLAARHRPPRGPRLTEDFTGIFLPRTALILVLWPTALNALVALHQPQPPLSVRCAIWGQLQAFIKLSAPLHVELTCVVSKSHSKWQRPWRGELAYGSDGQHRR